MITHKILFGAAAVLCAAMSHIYYIFRAFRHEARPHFFTWLIWVLVTGIICAAQTVKGAGAGSWSAGFTALGCLIIAIFALFKGDRHYTRGDWLALVIALAAIPLWLLTKEPFYSVLLLTLIDACGFIPTFRKAFHRPREESWISFVFIIIESIFVLLALDSYNRVTVTYPVAVIVIDSCFVLMVLWRRRAIIEGH